MELLTQDSFFSWPDLSVDATAKEKRYRYRKLGTGRIFIPNKGVLSIKWDIDAGAGNFQIFAVNSFLTDDPTVTIDLAGIDYSDGSEKTFPLTLQAGIGAGQMDLLIGPTAASTWVKNYHNGIYIAIIPAADQIVGWIKGNVLMLSD